MAAKTKIRVPLLQQIRMDRAVRLMAGHAALPQSLVLKNKLPRLLLVTVRALAGGPPHRQRPGLHDFSLVRIVAGHTAHRSVHHRMPIRQIKLGMLPQMAFEAGRRIASRIRDEHRASLRAAHRDVLAAGAVTGFATGVAHLRIRHPHARMHAPVKNIRDVLVAIHAGGVADPCRAVIGNRNCHRPFDGGTGTENQRRRESSAACSQRAPGWRALPSLEKLSVHSNPSRPPWSAPAAIQPRRQLSSQGVANEIPHYD